MKKYLIIYLLVFLVFMSGLLLADSFETLKKVITDSVPAGFTINKGQTSNSRFACKITYDKDSTGSNRLIYSLNPRKKEFSEMDLLFDHKKFTWQERDALFLDGSKTGMSGIKVILKNNAGAFSITHRAIGGTAMTKDELEKMLSTIALTEFEK